MTINNATTKKNLDEFISLTMNEGKKLGFSKSQLDDLYKNAIDVFFFNDLEKAPKISKQVVDYFWCGMNPLYYQNGREVAKMTNLGISKLFDKVDFMLDDDLTITHEELSYHGEPLLGIDGKFITIYGTYNGYDRIAINNDDDLNYAAMLITQALNNIEASQEMKGSN